MAQTLTVLMYHYVRDVTRTRFARLRALDVAKFRGQLAYVRRHYTVISARELMAAVAARRHDREWGLPRNALLLTFDDGYADHFTQVCPLLADLGLQGSFFAPASAISRRELLDVHKIHFVLASGVEPRALALEICAAVDEQGGAYGLAPSEVLYASLAQASRSDPPEVMFVKRALQSALPSPLREQIVGTLFHRYVSADERAFADELYLTVSQLRDMAAAGMYLGSHGDTHVRLGRLGPEAQAREVDGSLRFLADLGVDVRAWMIAYPYGDCDTELLRLLRTRGCVVGLTTRPAIATSDMDPLLLPRLAPNDLPTQADARPAPWTATVLTPAAIPAPPAR
jgi:peptidoglycan/xylan/chitin deacetylase (PgdA/CDA1 family)